MTEQDGPCHKKHLHLAASLRGGSDRNSRAICRRPLFFYTSQILKKKKGWHLKAAFVQTTASHGFVTCTAWKKQKKLDYSLWRSWNPLLACHLAMILFVILEAWLKYPYAGTYEFSLLEGGKYFLMRKRAGCTSRRNLVWKSSTYPSYTLEYEINA